MNEKEKAPEGQPNPEVPESQPAPSPIPPAGAEPALTPQEIEEGKVFAILSYALSIIGLPFFLVPLIMRNNEFSLYHAKQCLMIWLAGIAVGIAGGILTFICIGPIVWIVGYIFLLVISIIGLINAAQGQMKPLPLIGKWGEDWFKGLKKVQS